MNKTGQKIFSYAVVIAMALLLALNYHIFIIENNFAPAGLSGIATMIQYKTGFSISYITLIINIPLCALVFFLVSKDYGIKSFVFTCVYSASYLFLQTQGLDAYKYNAGGHDTVFPVIISGVLSGIVCGLCFKYNSASGGTEIISKYISHVKPNSNFFIVSFILTSIVAAVSLFVYSENALNYKPVALCITYCFVSNFVGNYIIKGAKTAYKFTVITTHPTEIAEEITHIIKHGATTLAAHGAYTKADKTVLLCVVNKHQLNDFKNIVEKYDSTFTFYEMVNETYGNFKNVK